MSRNREHQTCHYCDALLSKNNIEIDHFPIPQEADGIDTVVACRTCHDMKDRFPLDSWPVELYEKVSEGWALYNRETRIFLSKVMKLWAVHLYRKKPQMGNPDSITLDVLSGLNGDSVRDGIQRCGSLTDLIQYLERVRDATTGLAVQEKDIAA